MDINALRHPSEYSRLILAVAAAVIALGVLVLFAVIVYSTQPLVLIVFGTLLVVLAIWSIWLLLMVGRARLLGNSLFVSDESLPELQQVVDTVRDRVGYSRRVDVYVSEAANDPVTLATFMGTRVLILKAGTVADLQAEGYRPQLEFLLGSVFGTLKARHQQFILLSVLLEFETKLKVLDVFLAPYFRATVYTGDQIGAACCGSTAASLAMMNRLMVGKELASSVLLGGVLNQALVVRKRWLPRWEQMNSTSPHLTNRYLNLLAFMTAKFPQETTAYLDSIEEPTRELLTALNATSLHQGGHKRRHTLMTLVAALITVGVLVLVGAGMAQWRSEIIAAMEQTPTPAPQPEPEPAPEPVPTPTEPDTSQALNPLSLDFLLGLIPGDIEPCREVTVEAGFSQGAVRELECSPLYLDSFLYIQYESAAEMEAAYNSTVPAILPGSDCSVGASALSYNTSTNFGLSELSCYENQDGAIVFVWTSTVSHFLGESHLLGISTSNSLTYSLMYAEWEALVTQTS